MLPTFCLQIVELVVLNLKNINVPHWFHLANISEDYSFDLLQQKDTKQKLEKGKGSSEKTRFKLLRILSQCSITQFLQQQIVKTHVKCYHGSSLEIQHPRFLPEADHAGMYQIPDAQKAHSHLIYTTPFPQTF